MRRIWAVPSIAANCTLPITSGCSICLLLLKAYIRGVGCGHSLTEQPAFKISPHLFKNYCILAKTHLVILLVFSQPIRLPGSQFIQLHPKTNVDLFECFVPENIHTPPNLAPHFPLNILPLKFPSLSKLAKIFMD